MNHPELISSLTAIQAALWPAVSNQIAETIGQMVSINSPLVFETTVEETAQEFALPSVLVQFAFAGQRDIVQRLIFPLDTANALYMLLGGDESGLGEENVMSFSPFTEAVVQGLCLGLGNATNQVVVATETSTHLAPFTRPTTMQPTESLVRVQLALGIDSTVGSFTWLMDSTTAHFVSGLDQPQAAPAEPANATFNPLPPFGSTRMEEPSHGLDILMDVPLEVSVELGRTKLVVKEVVDLGIGSIVEIEKAAGEPVDILVNGRLVARGEVVVIEDNFGVRITEILNPRERLMRLGEAA